MDHKALGETGKTRKDDRGQRAAVQGPKFQVPSFKLELEMKGY